jgi:hypothetical protein
MVMPTLARDFKGERVPHPSFLSVGSFPFLRPVRLGLRGVAFE